MDEYSPTSFIMTAMDFFLFFYFTSKQRAYTMYALTNYPNQIKLHNVCGKKEKKYVRTCLLSGNTNLSHKNV